jgi:hypothetical protein
MHMSTARYLSAVTLLVLLGAGMMSPPALAQSPASNKAFFAKNTTGVVFATVDSAGNSDVVTLMSIPAALKTSNGGAISAIVSMEAAIWTYNLTTAIVNGGKSSSSSRAALKVWVEVDGVQMEPGMVVYADRLQATGLTVNLTCSVPGTTCEVNGDVTLELFQRTKNANSFTFFAGPLAPIVHKVEVKAQAFIECRSNGEPINCPASTLDGYEDASTQAAIGKATILVEEQQNWGKSGS